MKKLPLNKIKDVFIEAMNNLDLEFNEQIKNIKAEYQQNIAEECIKLLATVCEGEKLNFDDLSAKYLKKKFLNQIKEDKILTDVISSEDDIMDKVIINNIEYYYQPKDKSIVYDMNSKAVGIFKNGIVILN